MLAIIGLLFLLATSRADGDVPVESLIRQLGSPRYQEREEATLRIEAIGVNALPALKSARESEDLEVRTRAGVLADRIESGQLTKPTMITLDYQNQPISAVIAAINQRNGLHLTLMPDSSPIWQTRMVTFPEPFEPLPFWTAMDRLAERAGVHINPGMMSGNARREATLSLSDGLVEPIGYTSNQGPFRVSLTGISYSQNLMFTAGRRVPPAVDAAPVAELKNKPVVNEQFHATLQLIAEPRLMIQQKGPVRVTEAFDDRGQSLAPRPRELVIQHFPGSPGFHTLPFLQVQAELGRPKTLGSVIRRIKGTIPVTVSMRRPDPLVVTLGKPDERIFRDDEVTITIDELKQKPENPQRVFEILIKPNGLPRTPQGGPADLEMMPGQNDASQPQRIEVVNAQGHPLNWFPNNLRSDAEGAKISIIVPANGQGPAP